MGKTVPECQSDGRQFVCTAGWSVEHGPTRIYPMGRLNAPSRWSLCEVPTERNPKDDRAESWKISGDSSIANHDHTNANTVQLVEKIPLSKQREIVARMLVPSIAEANRRKISLCIIIPQIEDLYFGEADFDKERWEKFFNTGGGNPLGWNRHRPGPL